MVKRAGGALLLSLTIDRSSARPILHQLSASLRTLVFSGALGAGERLPASRVLAKELGVARSTVVNAYERLASEGILVMRTGAGTYVSDALNSRLPRRIRRRMLDGETRGGPLTLSRKFSESSAGFAHRLDHRPGPFTTAMPALDVFPRALWAKLAARHWRASAADAADSLGYGDPQGHPPLREAIVAHLRGNRGIECEAGQVFILGGAQQAFNVIAGVLLDAGDSVWFENPGAIGARNSFAAAGGTLIPVPVDDAGMVIPRRRGNKPGSGSAPDPGFRLAFVTPIHQQPTGVTLSLRRRLALLQAAEACNGFIVEDDYDGEFVYSGHPVPTLKSIDAAGRVLYVGTFSKTLFPALRLGYVVVADALVDAFRTAAGAILPGAPPHTQALVASFMGEGHFAAHLRRMRRIYAERLETLLCAAETHLDGRLAVAATNAGLHTVGYLADPYSEREISQRAAQQGVTAAPLGSFCLTPIRAKGLVLGFSGTHPEAIVQGVKILRGVFDQVDKARAG